MAETRTAVQTTSDPPRVLLGALDPILRVGIARALMEGGAAVDHATEADALVARAAECRPDAVVVGPAPGLSARLRVAAPSATVVIWRGDEEIIEVLAPGTATRVVPAPPAERLHGELFGRRNNEGGSCPLT
jgi:hypothetical protein